MVIKHHVKELNIGDEVYLYEIRETDDGETKIFKSKLRIDHETKFDKARGTIIEPKEWAGVMASAAGAAGTPTHNRLWLDKEDDQLAYKKFRDYFNVREYEHKKMYERFKQRRKFIESLMESK